MVFTTAGAEREVPCSWVTDAVVSSRGQGASTCWLSSLADGVRVAEDGDRLWDAAAGMHGPAGDDGDKGGGTSDGHDDDKDDDADGGNDGVCTAW